MVYTAIYSKNVLTYVALFHNDLCFMANHCIIRPILGVSSMGLHPGWILLPNITSQWSVLYGNPLKCKSNFRSLLHRISSRTRFTKTMFVWDKNPQNQWILHFLQFFMPVTNMDFILRLRQRFWLYSNFSHFLQDFTHKFFVYYQIVATFIKNHPTYYKMKTKTSH